MGSLVRGFSHFGFGQCYSDFPLLLLPFSFYDQCVVAYLFHDDGFYSLDVPGIFCC
jgi:hypothetical protein